MALKLSSLPLVLAALATVACYEFAGEWAPGDREAVEDVIDRLPEEIVLGFSTEEHPLVFVSNLEGRLPSGWAPYGGHPMAFYSNEDPPGRKGQYIVLIPGMTHLSVAHEIMHAYWFLDSKAGDYTAMAQWQVDYAVAVGWIWYNGLWEYRGSDPISGKARENPWEDFAVTGARCYASPDWLPRPDLPVHYRWFTENIDVC